MGRYKLEKATHKLDFSQTRYAGLEVTMRAAPLGVIIAWQDLAGRDDLTGEEMKAMFAGFAGYLESWNLDDDADNPVPATYEGVAAQEVSFVQALIGMYADTLTSAPPPLPGSSGSGGSSAAVPPPGVVSASASLPSSPAPS
ncbi:MAG TPA: hypothetical protein VGH27_01605 [Streptosporangiaceae bacterium]|jgi:hypothetical protein